MSIFCTIHLSIVCCIVAQYSDLVIRANIIVHNVAIVTEVYAYCRFLIYGIPYTSNNRYLSEKLSASMPVRACFSPQCTVPHTPYSSLVQLPARKRILCPSLQLLLTFGVPNFLATSRANLNFSLAIRISLAQPPRQLPVATLASHSAPFSFRLSLFYCFHWLLGAPKTQTYTVICCIRVLRESRNGSGAYFTPKIATYWYRNDTQYTWIWISGKRRG
jgi:hypothetical protein